MKTTRIVCLFAVVAMLAAPLVSFAQEAGIIEGIRGRAYWKQDARFKAVRLDPRNDKGRLLQAGEHLRCDPGGELRLRLYKRALSLPCTHGWFPIPYVAADKRDPVRQVLVSYGTRGGGERGITSIYSPANGANVDPTTFEMRWIPKQGELVVSVLIREASPSGREVFRQDIVDGKSSRFSSANTQQALIKYREERGHGPLLVVLLGVRQEIARVNFFLLSARDEQALDYELRIWNAEPEGIWRHLGMAHAFTARKMLTEAADEYEAALNYAPNGTDLLSRTIDAHQRTGNTLREQQLSARLSKKTRVSRQED